MGEMARVAYTYERSLLALLLLLLLLLLLQRQRLL